jgi:hypothetical protein
MTLPAGVSSADACNAVEIDLIRDESFCGQGGRFGAPLCDWFVIGGRRSGLLADTQIGPAYKEAVFARFPEMNQQWPQRQFVEAHAAELDAIWQEHGGTGLSPYTRNGFDTYDDDAVIVTPELYAALLAEYAGQVASDGEFVDLDCEPVGPDFIGRKWLVVVDYHN